MQSNEQLFVLHHLSFPCGAIQSIRMLGVSIWKSGICCRCRVVFFGFRSLQRRALCLQFINLFG